MRSLANGSDLAMYRRYAVPLPEAARRRVVLLLHPVSIPGAVAFDVKGYSLMDYLALQGFDVWAVDFRGFGRSSPAPVMINSRGTMAPTPRLENTLADAREAIDTILASTKAHDLALVGYGYGGLVAAMTAETYPEKVSRLVLYGTAFAFKPGKQGSELGKKPLETAAGALDARLPASQEIDWAHSTLVDWQQMMGDKALADPDAIAAVETAFYDSDYASGEAGQRKLRRPTGPLLDMYRVWSNHPAFNAARIKVPTLIMRGELDSLAEPDLAAKLSGTKILREVVVKDATQWMLYEKSRDQVLSETGRFLAGS